MNPVIVYVDDEPQNLVNFEMSLPEEWEIHVFENPLVAADKIADLQPWVVVSDQRMPGMSGVKFLEFVSKLAPSAQKIITTGYSDENLVIEAIRTAGVLDYITKPWNPEELPHRIQKAVDLYQEKERVRSLTAELEEQKKQLESANAELNKAMVDMSASARREESFRKELECWVPPIVTWATENQIEFPIKRNLALMAIDIIDSGKLHGRSIGNHSLRQKALLEFSMLVIKHGGYVENFEGDAAYANFGLIDSTTRPADAALAVANEFRAALFGMNSHHDQQIECGIGLHFTEDVKASINEYSVTTPNGIVVQKHFSTESTGIDLVHRMEKLTHELIGSNIIMTDTFIKSLHRANALNNPVDLGTHLFKGQSEAAHLHLIKSQMVDDEKLNTFIDKNFSTLKAA